MFQCYILATKRRIVISAKKKNKAAWEMGVVILGGWSRQASSRTWYLNKVLKEVSKWSMLCG